MACPAGAPRPWVSLPSPAPREPPTLRAHDQAPDRLREHLAHVVGRRRTGSLGRHRRGGGRLEGRARRRHRAVVARAGEDDRGLGRRSRVRAAPDCSVVAGGGRSGGGLTEERPNMTRITMAAVLGIAWASVVHAEMPQELVEKLGRSEAPATARADVEAGKAPAWVLERDTGAAQITVIGL